MTDVSRTLGNANSGGPDDPDVLLMLRVRDGAPGAFETLVERFQRRLLGLLVHLVGGPDEAEDLAQEVFLRVYRARKSYRPDAKFSTWLFAIAHNVARNHRRGKARKPTTRLEASAVGASADSSATRPVADLLPGPDATASAQLRKLELAQVVREALDGLGEDQKVAVLLNKFEGMGYAEIAVVMGKTEAAVKSLLARARYNLRDLLAPYLSNGQRTPSGPPRAEGPPP